jgi:hypothetical protein
MPHRADVQYNVPEWTEKPRDEKGAELPRKKGERQRLVPQNTQIRGAGGIESCYLPGSAPDDYRPLHAAKLVPAGTDMVFHLHYTPNGKDVVDHPQVGFTIATEEPQRRYVSLAAVAPTDSERFAIPPNDGDWLSPLGQVTFEQDAELVWMTPHMHLRGKDSKYTLIYPDGKSEVVLNVPRYDFNWQMSYEPAKPIRVPKGTKLVVESHFDNSPNNKFNPDPNATVYYGNMTWEEMMHGFFAVTIDKSVDPKKVLKKGAVQGQGG